MLRQQDWLSRCEALLFGRMILIVIVAKILLYLSFELVKLRARECPTLGRVSGAVLTAFMLLF